MEQNPETKSEKIVKEKKIVKPCRNCHKEKGRHGSYCLPCAELKKEEARKRCGKKPNYVKRNCTDCGGNRDRDNGYLCQVCYDRRKAIRKEVLDNLKETYKTMTLEKIKNNA